MIRSPQPPAELAAAHELWACYQCGKCTADCPFGLSPSLVVRLLQLGEVASARALETTWECASCFTCEAACPKGVSPYRVMKALRRLDGGGSPARPPGPAAPTSPELDGRRPPREVRLGALRHRLRARLLASMPRVLRVASRLGPLVSSVLDFPPARLAAQALVGVDRRRPMPPIARESFPAWFRRHRSRAEQPRGTVLLFHDTFMDFSYPQVGIAATEILETAGYRVALADNLCCGRPAISKGLDRLASEAARENVSRLHEAARRGIPIVGCEPSCLLTLRDEYPELVPAEERERARAVARQAFLLDEFLGTLRDRGQLDLPFPGAGTARPALFHGHCHQRARARPELSVELLRLAGYEAEMTNAACCGMAGAYGFEREHYERSREAGERALFPAIRSQPDAEIVVAGASCRQQIEHFLGRPVRHLAEALRDALAPGG